MVLVLLLSLAVVGTFFLNPRNDQPKPPAAAAAVPAKKPPVSEHDWAKNALNRADDVRQQVAQQRKENDAY